MFKNEYSDTLHKHNVHNLILQHLPNKYHKVLSLSALSQTLEYKVLDRGYKIHTVEYNEDIYNHQRKMWEGVKGITHYHSKVDVFLINRSPIYYDLAWLDFCSEFSRAIHTTLVNVRATTIALTVQMKREKYLHHLFNTLGRQEAYNYLFKSLGYKLLTQYEYIGGYHCPMCTFILTKESRF